MTHGKTLEKHLIISVGCTSDHLCGLHINRRSQHPSQIYLGLGVPFSASPPIIPLSFSPTSTSDMYCLPWRVKDTRTLSPVGREHTRSYIAFVQGSFTWRNNKLLNELAAVANGASVETNNEIKLGPSSYLLQAKLGRQQKESQSPC